MEMAPHPSYPVPPPRCYSVKKGYHFPVPSRDVTYQTLPGRELFYFIFPGQVEFGKWHPDWDGKTANLNLFYSVMNEVATYHTERRKAKKEERKVKSTALC